MRGKCSEMQPDRFPLSRDGDDDYARRFCPVVEIPVPIVILHVVHG